MIFGEERWSRDLRGRGVGALASEAVGDATECGVGGRDGFDGLDGLAGGTAGLSRVALRHLVGESLGERGASLRY